MSKLNQSVRVNFRGMFLLGKIAVNYHYVYNCVQINEQLYIYT